MEKPKRKIKRNIPFDQMEVVCIGADQVTPEQIWRIVEILTTPEERWECGIPF